MVIVPHVSVNGVAFGWEQQRVVDTLGTPDALRELTSGEIEFWYDGVIFRCFHHRFVECTSPDRGSVIVDGIDVLSVFDWLGAHPDHIDRARFRVVQSLGIAYDYRDPEDGSITVFERGRWDTLLEGA